MKIVAVEGIDGAGKTTLINNLKRDLVKNGKKVHVLKPIVETPSGLAVRKYLEGKEYTFSSRNHLIYSYLTAMLECMDFVNKIREEADNNTIVILDRWLFSTYIYGFIGYTADNSLETFKKMLESYSELVDKIDLTLLVDLDVDIALERIKARDGGIGKDYYSNKDKLEAIRATSLKAYELIKINRLDLKNHEKMFGDVIKIDGNSEENVISLMGMIEITKLLENKVPETNLDKLNKLTKIYNQNSILQKDTLIKISNELMNNCLYDICGAILEIYDIEKVDINKNSIDIVMDEHGMYKATMYVVDGDNIIELYYVGGTSIQTAIDQLRLLTIIKI